MQIRHGFNIADRALVAQLYWGAFGGKLGRVMGPEAKALRFIESVLRADHGISAYDGDQLLGVVGFKTHKGSLVGGGWDDMVRVYGWLGSAWRALLLELLERDTENQRFLMDGIFVAEHARGRGVGTALLAAIEAEARSRGYSELRLDVIDSNPRARALYERLGYEPVHTDQLGPLRWVFGFASSTTMVKTLT